MGEKAEISIKPGFVLACIGVSVLVGLVVYGLTGDAERAALWGGLSGGICCSIPFFGILVGIAVVLIALVMS